MKHILILSLLVVCLSGCQHLTAIHKSSAEVTSVGVDCVFQIDSNQPPVKLVTEQECQQTYWLEMWQSAVDQNWRIRRVSIDSLGRSPTERLQAFLLSQPLDTPYQYRLRAQSHFDSLRAELSPEFEKLLLNLAYAPSQKLLEYESAVTVLSQVNTRQKKLLDEQAQILLEQQEKLNQLLKIESTILENATEQ